MNKYRAPQMNLLFEEEIFFFKVKNSDNFMSYFLNSKTTINRFFQL